MATKTYTRIAHRAPSMWGHADTWRIDGAAYICNSGLTMHFDIPSEANELEVEIIVSKRRPDPQAQRIWGLRGDTLDIEGVRGNSERLCVCHSMHPRFRNQIRTARKYAREHESKIWMLCRYKTVTEEVARKGGERRSTQRW